MAASVFGNIASPLVVNYHMDATLIDMQKSGVTKPGYIVDLEERMYVTGDIDRPSSWKARPSSDSTAVDASTVGSVSEAAKKAFAKQDRRLEVETRVRQRFGADA